MRKLKFIDLFAGIGGMRIALEQAGMKCVFSSDINKDCQDVYAANFGERPFGDIKDINPQNIPDFDVLCAGFPCQPFSISGHKKGFEDARGTLFFEILRILEVKKPATVLLENVKHLIHHNRGETLRIIMQSLKDLGYKISYKILNAKNFGSAQNRERLIIVGHKDRRFNFYTLRRIPNRIIEDILENTDDFEYLKSEEYTLIEYPKRQASGLIFAGYRNKKIRQNGIRPNTLHLSRVHKQPNRIYSAQGTHPTLPSQESSGRFWILHNNKVRKLTIRECYRLQGFPDNFKLSKSQTQQYLQIGNSIYIPMFQEIGQAIIDQLYGKNYKEEIYEQSYTNLRFPLQLSPR
ncbi:MAG: DNA (cytosine-5-)-methyltransferase [Candidatus Saccharibacteria bacterium]|nr:DNA (cytosine-5-)-methyltransferase [Candidatus Saccharibacteria bacterium]